MYLRNIRLAVVCLVAAACPVLAQENTGYTSVALFKVKPDGAAAFVENLKKVLTPACEKLLKDGTIEGYGLDMDMFHQPGAPNAALWLDVPTFAAFGKMEEAIGAAMKASPQAMAGIMAATDPAAHSDTLVRHLFFNMKRPPAGSLPYTNLYSVQVKPGKMEEFSQAFEKYQKPIYDKLVADGAILGYTVDTEAIHTEAGSTVWILTVMADLSGKDKTLAATRAAPDRRAATVLMNALTVEGSHRDNISQAVIFVTK
jgi:DNA-binding Lrp family transcriptional regulator